MRTELGLPGCLNCAAGVPAARDRTDRMKVYPERSRRETPPLRPSGSQQSNTIPIAKKALGRETPKPASGGPTEFFASRLSP